MDKHFEKWICVKRRLHETPRTPPLVSEGDIWWVSFGENVGTEINGKSVLFSRPAIIYRKLSQHVFMVLPTTTRPKVGSWYAPIHSLGVDMRVCLHQARTIDHRRLSTKMGSLDASEANLIRDGFQKLYQ